MLISHPIS